MQVIDSHIAHHAEATGRRYAVLYHRRRLTNALLLYSADVLMLTLATLLAGGVRWVLKEAPMIPSWIWLLFVAWGLGALVFRLLPGWGLGAVETLRRTMSLLGLLLVGTALGLFLTKSAAAYSRLTVSLLFAFSIPLLPYGRMVAKKLLIRSDRWGLPAAIYGGGRSAERVIEALREEPGIGYVPAVVFSDNPDSWGDYLQEVPVMGGLEQSMDEAPVAIVAMPDIEHRSLASLLEGPLSHYKQIVIIPDLFEVPTLWVRTRDIAGVLGLEITSNLLDPVSRFIKRAMDLLLVLATLPLWLPLCSVLAAAIWLADRQSPFFLQQRVGKQGERFYTIKFRTMVPDAERVLRSQLATDEALRTEWQTTFKLRKDPRITRLGRFLRRTSLDELPQLFNVLRGEMSLVGPRPLPVYHLEDLSERVQALRTRLRPGLTGLWQVSGRSDSGNEGFERWDAYYVRNWSVWLDTVILVRTIRVLWQREGAY